VGAALEGLLKVTAVHAPCLPTALSIL